MCLLGYREQRTETPLGKQGESTGGEAGRGREEYLAGWLNTWPLHARNPAEEALITALGQEGHGATVVYKATRDRGLFAEEFFDGCEFGFGHVQIFLGAFGVLFLHGGLGFGDVCPHPLLGGDDVAA